MTLQPGKKTSATHILLNISRTKWSQTVIFGQLIKYNLKNILRAKSYTKWGGETFARPFSKISKLSVSLDQKSNVLYSLFLSFSKLRVIDRY